MIHHNNLDDGRPTTHQYIYLIECPASEARGKGGFVHFSQRPYLCLPTCADTARRLTQRTVGEGVVWNFVLSATATFLILQGNSPPSSEIPLFSHGFHTAGIRFLPGLACPRLLPAHLTINFKHMPFYDNQMAVYGPWMCYTVMAACHQNNFETNTNEHHSLCTNIKPLKSAESKPTPHM